MLSTKLRWVMFTRRLLVMPLVALAACLNVPHASARLIAYKPTTHTKRAVEMSITNEAWNDIWNNGYQDGWNERYHQDHAVTPAPTYQSLCISQENWDDVWNAGFQKAYGHDIWAPGPNDIPHDDSVCPPPPPQPPGGPVAGPAGGPLPTIYGQPMDGTNMQIANALLNKGVALGARDFLLEAIIYAAMGESGISPETDRGGPLQTTCNLAAYSGGRDWSGQAYGWFAGGECFSSGGGFYYSTIYHQVWQVANAVEENAIWASSRRDSYARGGFSTSQLEAEASAIVSYLLPGLGTVVPSTPPAPTPADSQAVFRGLNWAGGYEIEWQRLYGGVQKAHDLAVEYNNRLVRFDYVKPNTFD